MLPIETILNYFLGSTTLISIYIAWKSRNSELKKTEASALEAIDSIYTKMSVVTDKKFEEMQRIIDENTIEIKNLKEQLQEYQKRCKLTISTTIPSRLHGRDSYQLCPRPISSVACKCNKVLTSSDNLHGI